MVREQTRGSRVTSAGKLILVPVESVVQMRPSFPSLEPEAVVMDTPMERDEEGDEDEDEIQIKMEDTLQPVHV